LVAVWRFPVFLTRLNSTDDFKKRFDNMIFQLSPFASSRLYGLLDKQKDKFIDIDNNATSDAYQSAVLRCMSEKQFD
jgi:hypothetical protein